ncbi:M56 family metallopeptidase [Schlesneria paludicola]|uniref:M56 family metallopeptidase n=1 Tax=Schlesneria paludicola TaxID=360056 RepID=UPI00029A428F|nr:M56 family metallopeptidase [Schlesneria paludicola]
MTTIASRFVEATFDLLLITTLQYTLFAVPLLIGLLIWHRRPAICHALALVLVSAALVAPLAATTARQLHLCWLPLPAGLTTTTNRASELSEPESVDNESANTAWIGIASPVNPHEHPVPKNERTEQPASVANRVTANESPTTRSLPPVVTIAKTAVIDSTNSASSQPDVAAGMASGKSMQRFHLMGFLKTHASKLRTLLVAVWLMGFAYRVWQFARLCRRVHSLVEHTTLVTERRILDVLQEVADQLELRRTVTMSASPALNNPFVFGVIHTQVIVPIWLLSSDNESQLRHVLLHELSHIARGDLQIGLIQRCATTLFWFHPLVHLASIILSNAREELCDNDVLRNSSAVDYSRTLLRIAEMFAGPVERPALSLFSRRQTLESRIAALLDPRRDQTTRLPRRISRILVAIAGILGFLAAGVGTANSFRFLVADAEAPANAADGPRSEQQQLIDRIRARVKYMLGLSATIKKLEYELELGGNATSILVEDHSAGRLAPWQGTTLQGGLQQLLNSPDRFDIQIDQQASEGTLILHAVWKVPEGNFSFHCGNGVQDTYQGYFSHPARETTITIDAKSFVPLKELTRDTTVLYENWEEVETGRSVPRQIQIIRYGIHDRLSFDWLGQSIWLLRSSESLLPRSTMIRTYVRNVRIDSKAVERAPTAHELRSRAGVRALRDLLDHNRPWLDRGLTGSGWKPPFETLSYTFHTEREDILESCNFDRTGEAVFEVTRDGKGQVKNHVGALSTSLNTQETADAMRDANYAHIQGRPKRPEGPPRDLALKHYARIGCQFDLPLFHYQGRLESAEVEIADGEWNGTSCRKVIVTNLSGRPFLGCGTMFGFTSWSYVHHIYPESEVLYVDPARNQILHETLIGRDRTFEIDFGDYVEVASGQFAPLSIRIESPAYFTCEYRFQIVGQTHWMLDHVASWFDPNDKSRGIVKEIEINGGHMLLDNARRQVANTRQLFQGEGESQDHVNLAQIPFVLGSVMQVGSYKVQVTSSDAQSVVIDAKATDAAAPDSVPICFFDADGRLLFAPTLTLEEQNGVKQGQSKIRGSEVWNRVRFVASPALRSGENTNPVSVIPFHWNEPIAVNVAAPRSVPSGLPRDARPTIEIKTRSFRMEVVRDSEGRAKAKLNVVSLDGPQEFWFDIALALISESGDLLSTGHLATALRVEFKPVENQFEVELGSIPAGTEPRHLIVGLSPGNITGGHVGSMWGQFMNETPAFSVITLLKSGDEHNWKTGMAQLAREDIDIRIFKEFHDEYPKRLRSDGSRIRLLEPHRDALRTIVAKAQQPDALAAAVRFLAYSEDQAAAKLLEPLLRHPSAQVQEAAAIGLTFLHGHTHFERVRNILASKAATASLDKPRFYDLQEQDALISLVHHDSDRAVDLLGTTLLDDLKQLTVERDEKDRIFLAGSHQRALNLCNLLGNTGRPRAASWIMAAIDLLAERQEIAKHFEQYRLLASALKFEAETQAYIMASIETGKFAGEWIHALRYSKNPQYVSAVLRFHQSSHLTAHDGDDVVSYLSNINTPESLVGLQNFYESGWNRDDRSMWLHLCQSLAATGDARGLKDAFETLVMLDQTAQPPATDREHRTWKSTRDQLHDQAMLVITKANQDTLAKFLVKYVSTQTLEEQHVVLECLWTFPTFPHEFGPVLKRWSESENDRTKTSAKRLMNRG